jgi:outer membrane protein OmpA-like peptidoglycan-associated protein
VIKRRLLALGVAVAGLGAIGYGQGLPNRHAIEDNLTQRSTAALEAAGLSGVKVSFVGRDGTLFVPRKSDLDLARKTVEGVDGVRVVEATAPEPPAPVPPKPVAKITVNGANVTKQGDAAIVDAVVKALGASAENVTIELADGKITLTGKVESAAVSAAAEAAAAQVVGAANVTNRLELAAKPEVIQRKLSELPQITFENDSATLTPEGQAAVVQAAVILRDNPSAKVRIEGHTDSNGTPQSNVVLSGNRALTVLNALVAQGIDASRLTSEGFGESRPRVPDTSVENRALNRRVEFVVL